MESFTQTVGIISLCLLAVVLLGFSGLAIASITDVKRYLRIRRM